MTEHGNGGRWVINSNAILHQQRERRARQAAKQADIQEQPSAPHVPEQPGDRTLTDGEKVVYKNIFATCDRMKASLESSLASLDRTTASLDRMAANVGRTTASLDHMTASLDRMTANTERMNASLDRSRDYGYSRTGHAHRTRSVPHDFGSWVKTSAFKL